MYWLIRLRRSAIHNIYKCWITISYTWNWHNIVCKLYFNKKRKKKIEKIWTDFRQSSKCSISSSNLFFLSLFSLFPLPSSFHFTLFSIMLFSGRISLCCATVAYITYSLEFKRKECFSSKNSSNHLKDLFSLATSNFLSGATP